MPLSGNTEEIQEGRVYKRPALKALEDNVLYSLGSNYILLNFLLPCVVSNKYCSVSVSTQTDTLTG